MTNLLILVVLLLLLLLPSPPSLLLLPHRGFSARVMVAVPCNRCNVGSMKIPGLFFTFFKAEISGTFAQNHPLWLVFTSLAHSGDDEHSARRFRGGYFTIFFAGIFGIFLQNPAPKSLHRSLAVQVGGAWCVTLKNRSAYGVSLRLPSPFFQRARTLTAVVIIKWKNPRQSRKSAPTAKPAGPRTRARRPK